MSTISTHFPLLNNLACRLDKANVNGAKPELTNLPKEPTLLTWEAHKMISRAVAKFHYDEMICADLLDLQYKFYNRCNLSQACEELVSEHLQYVSTAELAEIKRKRDLKKLAEENEKKKREEEARNSGF